MFLQWIRDADPPREQRNVPNFEKKKKKNGLTRLLFTIMYSN